MRPLFTCLLAMLLLQTFLLPLAVYADITGTSGNDTLTGTSANDTINCGNGTDTVLYNGTSKGYLVFAESAGKYIVNDVSPADGDDGRDTLIAVEFLQFADLTMAIADAITATAPQIIDDDGNLWDSSIKLSNDVTILAEETQLYRLYSGAMNRTPDDGGYRWWLNQIQTGLRDFSRAAEEFMWSPEFLGYVDAERGDSIPNDIFMSHMYQGVFGREPDEGGLNWWTDQLEKGLHDGQYEAGYRSQVQALVEMTQSNEYVELTLKRVVDYIASLNSNRNDVANDDDSYTGNPGDFDGQSSDSLCSDTCLYADDGACDDGGEGSSYSLCTLGSDCSDCGDREDPGENAVCSDTCLYADDGACDDGGEGSSYSICTLGSDCSDCGDRGDPSKNAVVVGTSVDLSSKEILPSGDLIIIDNPSHPLNGMEITVPPGAYVNTIPFQISAAPVESHTLGDLFEPLSPMITVKNGGQYSEEPMTVKIPVTVPENHFAMAFYYDDTKGTLEPMQLISTDSESVTVSTHHFSDIIVTGIAQSVLDTYLAAGIQSGFSPGVDDWSFVNRGSYIVPGGHCSGQSIGALWYYTAKPEGDQSLWGRYDNNFKNWSTPELWQDDSYVYRFASVLQKDENVNSFAEKFWTEVQGKMLRLVNNQWELVDVPGIGPEGTRNMFALSMLLTHEPQYVGIYSSAGGGHAMIAYAVTRDALHVADPNYPGDINRTIYYSNGSFDPYASGDNWEEINAGRGINYETIQYLAKSNLIPSEKIAQRWEEVKNGTIGNDIFPSYQIKYLDEDTGSYKTLAENQIVTKSKIRIVAYDENSSMGTYIYKNSEILPFDPDWRIDLTAGNNLLGIHVVGTVEGSWEYIDFKYINVIYEPEESEGDTFQYSTSFDLFYDPNYRFSFNVNGRVLNVINPNVELKDYASSITKLLRISNVSDDEQPTISGSIAPEIPTHFIYTNFNGTLIEERTYTNPRLQLYNDSSGELLKTFTDLHFTWTADPGDTWDGTYEVRVVLVYNLEQKTTKKEYIYNETTQENELVVKDISYHTEPENEIFRLDINVEKDASLHK